MRRKRIGIVTPALPAINNGNGRTAHRWAQQLAPQFEVNVLPAWQGEAFDLLIALHAHRSARSIADWARRRQSLGGQSPMPLVVALTGTDLYGAWADEPTTRRSLELADALVVLQDLGPLALAPAMRGKVRVIYQSGLRRQTPEKTTLRLRVLAVGHLRDEKQPRTLLAAARMLRHRRDIRIDHIGAGLDARLASAARRAQDDCAGYSWLGALPHARTLRWIQRAHVLVHPSRVEGGAHAVLEAVLSGTPVIASDIAGNRGMLGADYDGYVPVGDARALALALERCRDDPRWLDRLRRQCARRAALFDPQRERRALCRLVREMLVRPQPDIRHARKAPR